jgi:exodeoxyribonuclease VII small subunit
MSLEQTGTNVQSLSYEQALEELDDIIGQLDAGSVDVDILQVRFKRAVEIVEELDSRIMRAKEEVDSLLPRLSGINGKSHPQAATFEDGDEN